MDYMVPVGMASLDFAFPGGRRTLSYNAAAYIYRSLHAGYSSFSHFICLCFWLSFYHISAFDIDNDYILVIYFRYTFEYSCLRFMLLSRFIDIASVTDLFSLISKDYSYIYFVSFIYMLGNYKIF